MCSDVLWSGQARIVHKPISWYSTLSRSPCLPHHGTMVNFTILAGGSSSFIASYMFNADAGVLQYTGQSQTGANPLWMARHLTNPNILYAVNRDGDADGGVQSFTIGKGGALTAVGYVSSQGVSPAFVTPLASGGIATVNVSRCSSLISLCILSHCVVRVWQWDLCSYDRRRSSVWCRSALDVPHDQRAGERLAPAYGVRVQGRDLCP